MKRLVRCSLGDETVVVEQDEIARILFHKGRMRMLDQVIIDDGIAVGEFVVPDTHCEGHEPMPGMPVLRGSDIADMAYQLLGVIVAKLAPKCPELAVDLEGKRFFANEITGVKFRGFTVPGERLVLQTSPNFYVNKAVGTIMIESNPMLAQVGGKKRAEVSPVIIVAFDPKRLVQRKAL